MPSVAPAISAIGGPVVEGIVRVAARAAVGSAATVAGVSNAMRPGVVSIDGDVPGALLSGHEQAVIRLCAAVVDQRHVSDVLPISRSQETVFPASVDVG